PRGLSIANTSIICTMVVSVVFIGGSVVYSDLMPPREQALHIWQAAVAAVKPAPLVQAALTDPGLSAAVQTAGRILVPGAGKAGAGMSAAVESALSDQLDKVSGWVNVPAEAVRPVQRIHLHPARPAGVNRPTPEGVIGAQEILRLAKEAGPD